MALTLHTEAQLIPAWPSLSPQKPLHFFFCLSNLPFSHSFIHQFSLHIYEPGRAGYQELTLPLSLSSPDPIRFLSYFSLYSSPAILITFLSPPQSLLVFPSQSPALSLPLPFFSALSWVFPALPLCSFFTSCTMCPWVRVGLACFSSVSCVSCSIFLWDLSFVFLAFHLPPSLAPSIFHFSGSH